MAPVSAKRGLHVGHRLVERLQGVAPSPGWSDDVRRRRRGRRRHRPWRRHSRRRLSASSSAARMRRSARFIRLVKDYARREGVTSELEHYWRVPYTAVRSRRRSARSSAPLGRPARATAASGRAPVTTPSTWRRSGPPGWSSCRRATGGATARRSSRAIDDIEYGASTLLLAAVELAGAGPTRSGGAADGARSAGRSPAERATTGRWSEATRARRVRWAPRSRRGGRRPNRSGPGAKRGTGAGWVRRTRRPWNSRRRARPTAPGSHSFRSPISTRGPARARRGRARPR